MSAVFPRRRIVLVLAALFAFMVTGAAWAQQTVLQGGPWTPSDIPVYSIQQGNYQPVVVDSGVSINARGVVGPSTSTIGDLACWGNTTGSLLLDTGLHIPTAVLLGGVAPSGGSCGSFTVVTLAGSLTYTGTTLSCTTATISQLGCVEPDNSTITISGGVLSAIGASCVAATPTVLGCVKPDGTIITDSAGAITVPKASSSVFGVVKVDGTTITASSGVISAVSSGGCTVTSGSSDQPIVALGTSGCVNSNTVVGNGSSNLTITSGANGSGIPTNLLLKGANSTNASYFGGSVQITGGTDHSGLLPGGFIEAGNGGFNSVPGFASISGGNSGANAVGGGPAIMLGGSDASNGEGAQITANGGNGSGHGGSGTLVGGEDSNGDCGALVTGFGGTGSVDGNAEIDINTCAGGAYFVINGITNAAGNEILCWDSATFRVTYENAVAGCVPSAAKYKTIAAEINPDAAYLALYGGKFPLHAVEFQYKAEFQGQLGAHRYIGYRAEDVCALSEDLCVRDASGGIDNYDTRGLLAYQQAAQDASVWTKLSVALGLGQGRDLRLGVTGGAVIR